MLTRNRFLQMNRITSILILTILIFSNIYGQDSVYTEIKTNRNDAIIFIDDKFAGIGNLNKYFNEGVHSILIKESQSGWDCEVICDTIEVINDGGMQLLEYKFSNKIFINSFPSDALIYQNQNLLGRTPDFIPNNNIDTLEILKYGYKSKIIDSYSIGTNSFIPLEFLGEKKKEGFVKSPWFKILIGSAVIFGATAAYFKIEADKEYDKYLETLDNQYMNKTNKLDLYSGLAYGALQLNFGVLIYYLFKED